MSRALVLKADIAASLRELGLEPGDVVIVHCSLGSFGFVCGGAQTVIEALLERVGAGARITSRGSTTCRISSETARP